jgi:hypothetical protein
MALPDGAVGPGFDRHSSAAWTTLTLPDKATVAGTANKRACTSRCVSIVPRRSLPSRNKKHRRNKALMRPKSASNV